MVPLALLWLFFQAPPPERRGDALVLVQTLPAQEVTPYCQSLGLNFPSIAACTRGGQIFMPNPCAWPRREAYAELLCHELGHRNGWVHDEAGNDITPPPEPPPTPAEDPPT